MSRSLVRYINKKILLKWSFGKVCAGVDCAQMAQNRAQLRAFVNAVMNVWVSY
jgi:hypothetical protein